MPSLGLISLILEDSAPPLTTQEVHSAPPMLRIPPVMQLAARKGSKMGRKHHTCPRVCPIFLSFDVICQAFRAVVMLRVCQVAGYTCRMLVNVTTGGQWTVQQGPNILDDLYTGEVWDERLNQANLWMPSTQTDAHQFANQSKSKGVNATCLMSPQLMPDIRVVEESAPLAVTPVFNSSATLFTFPRSVAGVARIQVALWELTHSLSDNWASGGAETCHFESNM